MTELPVKVKQNTAPYRHDYVLNGTTYKPVAQ